jgi:dihydrofolate synthase/folylpolyglutamate synthase
LPGPRGAGADELASALAAAGITGVPAFDSPAAAFAFAKDKAGDNDRILVFGSFLTVADVMRNLARTA